MHCPFCHNPDSRVVDTRIADDGASIRRRRECTVCKKRFTTIETSSFQVVKNSGAVEPFSRNKVIAGVRKACQGRPVTDHDLALLAQQVEEHLRSSGVSNVSSEEVGKAILPFLSQLDEIAFLRFASVYRSYNSLEDFEDAIAQLRRQREERDEQADADKTDQAGTADKADQAGTSRDTDQATTTGTADTAREPAQPASQRSGSRKRPTRKPRKKQIREEEPTLLDS